ncbi:aldo/keto reductase, partial [Candidatus Bathyarchaeota archaeon]
ALKMLRTDRIEIVQFRVTKEQFKKSLGENGGFKVLLRAQKEGVVSHIGITDHDPSFLAEAIKTGLFSNVIVPYNYVFREAERESFSPSQGA